MNLKAFNKYIIDDARNLGKAIMEEVVDVIITSPPYANLKNYNCNGQIGFGQNYTKEYLPALADVFGQCLRVTKKTGSLWIVSDTFKKRGVIQLLPFHIADLCTGAGWKLRDIIIWDKTKSLPWSNKGRLRNTFEYILFFTKTHQYKPTFRRF